MIKDIGMSRSMCGLCCGKLYPCDSCIVSSLESNGLPTKYLQKCKRLSHKNSAYAWNEYSEFSEKLKELIKIEFGEINE